MTSGRAGSGLLARTAHLVRRFWGFVTARPLSPAEQMEVARLLDGSTLRLFYLQQAADQRHAFTVAERVRPGIKDRSAVLKAALLHDVGKTEVRLGAIGRSAATVLDAMGVRLPARFARYRRHGAIGAELLEKAGCDPLTVAFARGHPGPVSDGVDPETWEALAEADHT